MRARAAQFLMLSMALIASGETAQACHKCRQTPCVLVAAPAPMPAYQCVTEMVPYTVYRPTTRIEYRSIQETIMTRVPQTTVIERQRVVTKPVWETTYVPRSWTMMRPVSETSVVNQQYVTCKPVSTVRQITEYCMQPYISYMSVPVVQKCGHCGKARVSCGCATVAQTCFTPVPVVRNVVETHYVSEVQTRPINVTTTRFVPEVKTENVAVRTCRIVSEVVTDKIPMTTILCVPKTITRQVPVPIREMVAVTCYRPVQHMVPVAPAYVTPAPQAMPTPMPTSQSAPSKQG